jgi:Asp-tRNA(Asn)/Glu-tRNA(Gln) amidotransferase A subunit family amidase
MPMGAQLVGRKGHDARLLAVAHWLAGREHRREGDLGGAAQAGRP